MTWTPLADLTRDIAGDLPEEAVRRWADPSTRTEDLARQLLAPFARHGLVVCSDTAGLSKMASTLPLGLVLRHIAEPKKRIHALGTGLGGRSIGIWVADNTEMFYPPDIPVDDLLAGMIRLHDHGPVAIGFCLHAGVFYEVGGGLYGPDADQVEVLAEVHTSGGDSLVTPAARDTLQHPDRFVFEPRDEPPFGAVFHATTSDEGPPHAGSPDFPIPYDPGMHALLERLDPSTPDDVLRSIDVEYRQRKVVLLMERHGRRPVTTCMETLDGLFGDRRFQEVAMAHLRANTPHWTVGGPLALAAFDDASTALKAATDVQREAAALGLTVSAGLDEGDAYLFPMPHGRTELAGDPVNRASKLAEDLADPGDLCMTERVADGLQLPGATPMEWTISGISLKGLRLQMHGPPSTMS